MAGGSFSSIGMRRVVWAANENAVAVTLYSQLNTSFVERFGRTTSFASDT
jgi:hypothetical protein